VPAIYQWCSGSLNLFAVTHKKTHRVYQRHLQYSSLARKFVGDPAQRRARTSIAKSIRDPVPFPASPCCALDRRN